MVSAGFTEGFYSKPRIDKDLLEQHHEGLICLSACLAGEIPQAILAGDYEQCKTGCALLPRPVSARATIISRLQDHGLEEARRSSCPGSSDWPGRLASAMVATNDAHYIDQRGRQDAKHPASAFRPIRRWTTPTAWNSRPMSFTSKAPTRCTTCSAMVPEACENTNKIAEQCNFEFEFGDDQTAVLYSAPMAWTTRSIS